jgi:hypothetical protein
MLTRTELEKLRAFVVLAVRLTAGTTVQGGDALAILDAALAVPEAREWRLTWRGGKSSPTINKQKIYDMLAEFNRYRDPADGRDPRIECRTPATEWKPWEGAK